MDVRFSQPTVIVSEVEGSRDITLGGATGFLQPSHKATAWQATSLGMTEPNCRAGASPAFSATGAVALQYFQAREIL